jgi:hypothetical protein
LQHRQPKVLNPHGRAPLTAAKVQMQALSLSDEEQFLRDRFDEGAEPFNFDLVRVDDLIKAMASTLGGRSNGRQAASLKFLSKIGAVPQTRYTRKPKDTMPSYRLWSVRNHSPWARMTPLERAKAYQTRQWAEPNTEEPGE